MTFGIYQAKRTARLPLIWYGRWRNADEPEEVRWRLEHNAYRRVARKAMANNAVDPYFYHRADLDSDSVVVDVGAFRGLVAQEFIDLYGCTVYAYEPNPDFYAALEARFADDERVRPRPFGLGNADATLEMQQLGLGSTVYGEVDDNVPTIDVEIRDVVKVLDELGHDRIDYLKLNIEGAEYDLFDRWFESEWPQRTRYLLIQFHEWYPNAHLRRRRIRRRLRDTHDLVWNFPWIYELWCAKDQPHPPPPSYSKAELKVIKADLRARSLAAETPEETRTGEAPTGG